MKNVLSRLFSVLALLTLAACGGGGGDSGTPPFGGGGGSSGNPTLTLAVSSSSVSPSASVTLTATVRDGKGAPLSGIVVTLSTGRSDLVTLGATSVLTDALGEGKITIAAQTNGITGADEVSGVATLGTTTVQSRVGLSVTGAAPSIQASVFSTTLRASAGPVSFSAVVRDARGQPLAGQIVSFASQTGAVRVGQASALTDASGTASTTVVPADASVGSADTLLASVTVSGRTLQSPVNVQVVSETPSIALLVTPSQNVGSSSPATVQAIVRDAAGSAVPNAVVSFSSRFGLGSFSAQTAATAAGTGSANVVLKPVAANTTGADIVVATVTVAGITRTAEQVVQFVGSAVPTTPLLLVNLSASTVTPQVPATVSLQLFDGSQQPVAGAVVSLATTRPSLGVLGAASVLTDSQGRATTTLSSAAAGFSGADELVASATVGGTRVQGTVGFTVSAAAPTIQIALAPDSALKVSAGPAQLSATVRDATGQARAGQLVRFESVFGLATLSAPSAVTNASGVAAVTVTPTSPLTNAADTLRVSTTLAGTALEATKSVDLVRESPSIDLVFTGTSSASTGSPAGLKATVRDIQGALVPNAVVRFSTQGGLGTFSANTAATGADGSASAFVSPATASTVGADTVVASTTVNGVTVNASQVVQFVSGAGTGSSTLRIALSSTSISSAAPATVTATLIDARGSPVPGQVITFATVRGLARTNVGTSLTDSAGTATVVLSPTSPTGAGADEIVGSVTFAGASLSDTKGFQINATNVALSFAALPAGFRLAEYGQTTLTLNLTGASVGAPVNVSISSSCVSQGKATLSPSTLTATGATAALQYRDNGCGALQTTDELQAVVVGSANAASLSLPLSRPGVSSIGFVQALPEAIYLKASGFVESSNVTFEVRDAAGNPLRDEPVRLTLLTGAGGVLMEGKGVGEAFDARSDAQGRVAVRVNSGTLPTPVRVLASISLTGGTVVSTVSSNLSVGIGLPSQLNFSMSMGSRNIEGYNIDGTANTYNIIAADRSGNPVPTGTSINFVTEGGTVEAIKQTQLVNGLARATANFISAEPRPVDGRVTVVAYALGEESFIDLNGNNVYDSGEPFQDLGNIFKDRNFDGVFDPAIEEFVPVGINNGSACVSSGNPLLDLDPNIPSIPGTCSGTWSGAGQVYVRRAVETVLSTSTARPLWASVGQAGSAGLESGCSRVRLQTGAQLPTAAAPPSRIFAQVGGDTWYSTAAEGSLRFITADANPGRLKTGLPADFDRTDASNYIVLPRLNPMAAGTTITATSPTTGFNPTVSGGTPVADTSEATYSVVGYSFTDATVTRGTLFVTFKSPSGLGTTVEIVVDRSRNATTTCAAP
ncbi:MAG: beta strand repeat-containing protein [Rubrivivax sp.]